MASHVTFGPVYYGYNDILVDGICVGTMGPGEEVWVSLLDPRKERTDPKHRVSIARFKYGADRRSRAKVFVRDLLNVATVEKAIDDLGPGKIAPLTYIQAIRRGEVP